MERYNINIEELIRKEALGILTEQETRALEFEKKNYSEAEFDGLVIVVLQRMEDMSPGDSLKDWQPDYEDIIRRGNVEAEIRRKTKKKRRIYLFSGMVAAILLFLHRSKKPRYQKSAC